LQAILGLLAGGHTGLIARAPCLIPREC
jgi:hypothetical protein